MVYSCRSGTRNLASLYEGVLEAARMGRRGVSGLWIFGNPSICLVGFLSNTKNDIVIEK